VGWRGSVVGHREVRHEAAGSAPHKHSHACCGGVPVAVEGSVVGAVAVSGLSEPEDMELADLGVAAIAGMGAMSRT
jgi:uncharacterized protein GlcG (DUF336 family)